jgi:hypothetical protein
MAQANTETEKRFDEVDSTGTNSRPRHDTISQTGGGVPDDTSAGVEIDPEEEKRLSDAIRDLPGGKTA